MATIEKQADAKRVFPASMEIKSGDTLYKVKSIYADKGDFRALWEELIIRAAQADTGRGEAS